MVPTERSHNLDPRLFRFRVPKKTPIEKGRYDFVLERCRGKKVLHLGCVDEGLLERKFEFGTLLHTELEKAAKEVWGCDLSREGIEELKKFSAGRFVAGDAEQLDQVPELRGQSWDVIVAAELIEHVDNPGLFLDSAKSLFSPETVMILTTPNAFCLTSLVFNVLGCEYVHPDHNCWFSWKTLSTLLQKNGYRICEQALYSYGVFDWKTFRKEVRKLFGRFVGKRIKTSREDEGSDTLGHIILNIMGFPLRFLCYKLNPFFGEGLMFVVKPL